MNITEKESAMLKVIRDNSSVFGSLVKSPMKIEAKPGAPLLTTGPALDAIVKPMKSEEMAEAITQRVCGHCKTKRDSGPCKCGATLPYTVVRWHSCQWVPKFSKCAAWNECSSCGATKVGEGE